MQINKYNKKRIKFIHLSGHNLNTYLLNLPQTILRIIDNIPTAGHPINSTFKQIKPRLSIFCNGYILTYLPLNGVENMNVWMW